MPLNVNKHVNRPHLPLQVLHYITILVSERFSASQLFMCTQLLRRKKHNLPQIIRTREKQKMRETFWV